MLAAQASTQLFTHAPFCFKSQVDGVPRTSPTGMGPVHCMQAAPRWPHAEAVLMTRWVDCAVVRATASLPAAIYDRAAALDQSCAVVSLVCVLRLVLMCVCVLRALCVVAIASSLFCVIYDANRRPGRMQGTHTTYEKATSVKVTKAHWHAAACQPNAVAQQLQPNRCSPPPWVGTCPQTRLPRTRP